MAKAPQLSVEDAETIALSALGFLAEDMPRLSRFLSLTGIDPRALRKAAEAPQTLIAVLDYLLADESLLLVFTASRSLRPDDVAPARRLIERAMQPGARP